MDVPGRTAAARLRSAAVPVAGALALVLIGLALGFGDGPPPPRPGPGCERVDRDDTCSVLFLGNSYTAGNDLPAVLEELAASAGLHVETAARVLGGSTLADHLAAPATTLELTGSTWNVVVLQEQSQTPAVEDLRQAEMYPAARELVRKIRAVEAQPLFFLTWGRAAGWPERAIKDYATMQAAVEYGYETIARELDVPLAPVGPAWSEALRAVPDATLWTEDGSHPAVAGTYLAACVFYATIFDRSPEGLAYRAGLSERTAALLQAVAWRTVAETA